jgi:hypothetical protein
MLRSSLSDSNCSFNFFNCKDTSPFKVAFGQQDGL